MKKKLLPMIIFAVGFQLNVLQAAGAMEFKMAWESQKLTDLRIEELVAVDLNGNGVKELLLIDFGSLSRGIAGFDEDHRERRESSNSHFMIWEWQGKEMKRVWEKQFPPTTRDRIKGKYSALINDVDFLMDWAVGGRKVVEAIPPYFLVEWMNGKYEWKEQYGFYQGDKEKLVGSWVFPFQDVSCYDGPFYDSLKFPNECLVAVRNFRSQTETQIITRIAEKDGRSLPSKLRVRAFEKGFPILWEGEAPWGIHSSNVLDPFNERIGVGLLIARSRDFWMQLVPQPDKTKYILRRVKGPGEAFGIPGISSLFQVKAGKTQEKDILEYWGYHEVEDRKRIVKKLRRVQFDSKQTEFKVQDISYPTHDNFLGIGSFALGDLDGDGLDEIVLIEQTGKTQEFTESVRYYETADYVRVLKWNGKGYEIAWTSPPLKKRESRYLGEIKVLVDDVIGNGKKQIIVGTGEGTIQIWDRK